MLNVLVAVSATAQRTYPDEKREGRRFTDFLASAHTWRIGVEYQGEVIDTDELFYKWLRCELVHTGGLPTDLRIDPGEGDPESNSIRAGGAPDYTLLLGPGWYYFFRNAVLNAPANADLVWVDSARAGGSYL
ncbi:MAG: hypothetical protein ACYC90_11605 [Candidatus Nanopelagicales bacterium]